VQFEEMPESATSGRPGERHGGHPVDSRPIRREAALPTTARPPRGSRKREPGRSTSASRASARPAASPEPTAGEDNRLLARVPVRAETRLDRPVSYERRLVMRRILFRLAARSCHCGRSRAGSASGPPGNSSPHAEADHDRSHSPKLGLINPILRRAPFPARWRELPLTIRLTSNNELGVGKAFLPAFPRKEIRASYLRQSGRVLRPVARGGRNPTLPASNAPIDETYLEFTNDTDQPGWPTRFGNGLRQIAQTDSFEDLVRDALFQAGANTFSSTTVLASRSRTPPTCLSSDA
jgi:hypothetical protein